MASQWISMLGIVVLAVGAAASEGILRTEIWGQESMAEKLVREDRLAEFRQLINGQRAKLQRRLRAERGLAAPRGPVTAPIFDYSDISYIVHVGVGTPAQKFRLVPDTATSATWVVDADCNPDKPQNCPDYCSGDWCELTCEAICCDETANSNQIDENQCDGKTKFVSGNSSTYRKSGRTWSSSHSRLSATGYVGTDAITFIGPNSYLRAEGLAFAQATHIQSSLNKAPVDGVLGLSLGETDNLSPIITNLMKENNVSVLGVGLTLDKIGGRASGQLAGSLTLGGVDSYKCGSFAFGQLSISSSEWKIRSTTWAVNGAKKDEKLDILFDSTTPFIYVPEDILKKLVEATKAQYNDDLELYTLDCKTKVNFSLGAYGENLIVADKALIWEIKPKVCVLAFRELEDIPVSEPDVILGTPFLTSYCIYLDFKNKMVNLLKKK